MSPDLRSPLLDVSRSTTHAARPAATPHAAPRHAATTLAATPHAAAPLAVLVPLVALVAVTAAAAGPLAPELRAQDVDRRTPNLSGGWVGDPASARFNFNHRFWHVGGAGGSERKVVNSPTMLLGVPIGGPFLVAGQFATNSLVVPGTFNEYELFARWAGWASEPLQVALTAAYNTAAESVDGEVSLRFALRPPEAFPGDSIQILGAVRMFSDVLGTGEAGWLAGGGVIFHVSPNVALAGDFGQLQSDGIDLLEDDGVDVTWAWGAGLQLRVPTTPHTLSIQATNTRTTTLQGSSAGFRTVWGFEFTVPLTYARLFP